MTRHDSTAPRQSLPTEGYETGIDAMVEVLRGRYAVRSDAVLEAMRRVRRHRFIPADLRAGVNPYGDYPCPIGMDQTISQPYIVAYMIEAVGVTGGSKVLEVGSGSGYVAAVAAEMGAQVFAVERIASLADRARATLAEEGYSSVCLRTGDGTDGWKEHAPYDAIVVSCAVAEIPSALKEQLAEGGMLMAPVGQWSHRLVLLRKEKGRITETQDMAVRFVPLLPGVVS